MNNVNLEKLVDKAGEMAMHNVWGENAYKINMAIIKVDQKNCAAYTRLAKYYKLTKDVTKAKNMYLKVLEIDPKNWGAINNLDYMEKDQQENDEIDKIKTTAELMKLGHSSLLKGRYKHAAKLFARAYSIEPSLTYAVSLANAYKKMGKFDKIEMLYKQLIDDNHVKEDVEAINNEFKLLRHNPKSLIV